MTNKAEKAIDREDKRRQEHNREYLWQESLLDDDGNWLLRVKAPKGKKCLPLPSGICATGWDRQCRRRMSCVLVSHWHSQALDLLSVQVN